MKSKLHTGNKMDKGHPGHPTSSKSFSGVQHGHCSHKSKMKSKTRDSYSGK